MDTSKNVQSTQVDTTKSSRSPVSSQGLDGSQRKEQMTTNDKQRTYSVKTKLIVSLVLLLVYVDLTVILGNSTQIAEWFARNFSRGWITVWGTLTGWLPFSMYELFLIVAIVAAVVGVVFVIVWLCKRKLMRAGKFGADGVYLRYKLFDGIQRDRRVCLSARKFAVASVHGARPQQV